MMSIGEKDMNLIVSRVLKELKNKNLLNTNKDSYKSTEKILYSYIALPESLKLLYEEISKLEVDYKNLKPTNIKSKTLILNEENQTYFYGNESLESRISELKQIAIKTKSIMRITDKALKSIKEDKYYDIIPMYYFKDLTIETIAEHFNVSLSTIHEHKKILVNKLKVYIFPVTFINEL